MGTCFSSDAQPSASAAPPSFPVCRRHVCFSWRINCDGPTVGWGRGMAPVSVLGGSAERGGGSRAQTTFYHLPLPRTSRHVGSWVSRSPRGQGAKDRSSLHPDEPPGGFSPPGDWRSPLSELRVLTADMCGSGSLCSGRKKTSLGHKSILAPRTCSVGI